MQILFFGLTTHITYCDGDKISFFADTSTMFIQSCSEFILSRCDSKKNCGCKTNFVKSINKKNIASKMLTYITLNKAKYTTLSLGIKLYRQNNNSPSIKFNS